MKKTTIKKFRIPCRNCGRRLFKISQRGLCIQCSKEKVKLANLEMKFKQGPIYDKWKNKMQTIIFGEDFEDVDGVDIKHGSTIRSKISK